MKAQSGKLGKVAVLLSVLFIATMVLVLCQTANQAAAQDDVKIEAEKKKNAEFVLKLAYTDAANWPASGIKPLAEHAFALIFKSIVESRSNGAMYVELFPATSMGQSKEVIEMVQTGTLEMGIQTGALAGVYPPVQVINLPYAFQSDEIAWWIFDNSEFWKKMTAEIEEKTGIKVLAMGQNGTRHFTNSKRPIREPKDMVGLKFRVMPSPIYVKTLEAMGASATPLAHGEIYTSCQTKVVDGQENPIWNIAANKWYEVQDYMTLDGHTWSEDMLIINANFFNNLPKAFQQIIRAAAYQGQTAGRASESLGSLVTDFAILEKNMEIYSPTPEEMAKFKAAVVPVADWLKQEIGAKYVDDFYKAVEEAEAALGYR